MIRIFILFLCASLLTACRNPTPQEGQLGGTIRVDGSSTVYPLTEAAAEDFRYAEPAVKVMVGVSGTGGGFKKFGRGETDISNASRPISAEERKLCEENGIEFVEIPVAYDGLAVVVHPSNDFVDHLTVEELKRIWEPSAQDRVNRWSQVREGWPDKPLNLYGAGVASGTYDYFTEAVMGKARSSRGDYTSSEDDNVLVQGIAGDQNALGYFGLAYFEENQDKLRLVPVDPGDGVPVLPTPETVSNGSYRPLSRPEFIYINAKSLERPEVVAFVEFYLTNASALAQSTQQVPLGDAAYVLAMEKMRRKITGSAFADGRSTVGVKMEELLSLPSSTPDSLSGQPR